MTQPPDQALVELLDGIDPFRQDTATPAFDEDRLRALGDPPEAVRALIRFVADDRESLGRRYAAAEAIVQLGATRALAEDAPARSRVAALLTSAMPRDAFHNRWGLPGHFVGPMGKLLLALGADARAALLPLLNDVRQLDIVGSQAATLQTAHRYRIRDLASYLLALHDGKPWQDDPDPAVRDGNLDAEGR